MDKQIIYYYQRGVASYLIAKKFGVSNNYVRDLLKKHGIKLRGHNITNKVSAAKRTPEENREITRKAAEANKDSTHTHRHRMKLALSRERNPAIDPTYEAPLIKTCEALGVKVIPQKAFDKFNVDLYLPDYNVVIELFGGNFHNKPDAVRDFNNKMKVLSNKKVPVVIVWADKLTYSPKDVLDVALNVKKPLTNISGDGSDSLKGLSLLQSAYTHNDS